MNTVAGQTYQVNFEYGAISESKTQTLSVQALGGTSFSTVLGFSNAVAAGTQDLSAMLFGYSFLFTADSSNTRLQFSDTSTVTISVDGVLDNITVTPVPEPQIYALMLAGLTLLKLLVRSRNAA